MDKQEKFMLDLETKYPKLFKKKIWPEFNEGWYPLVEQLSAEISAKYDSWGSIPDLPYVAQMKEKFGGLRFYLESDTFFMDHSDKYDELDQIISKYESLSKKTCELCGKEGKVDNIKNGYWIKTLCEDCN